jgi:hypothetical protein
MSERRFEQTVEIAAAPDVVHAFLLDLHHHRDLHPLIERIEDLPSKPERPTARRYRITDRLRLGPIAFRIAYVAEIEDVSPSEIRGHAWQSPGVGVRTRYRIEPTPAGGTRLSEACTVSAPWLLAGYAGAQAEMAHRETLAKLQEVLASRSSSA